MRKLSLISIVLLIVSIPTFAGGLLTNTNQHVLFLRMLARDASTDIDAVYSNPAGLAFMEDGFHLSFNGQSAFQTRTITSTFAPFAGFHLFPVCLLFIRKAIGRFPEVLQ